MTHAVLVAHGAPSDPMPQERALEALAARVQAHLPDWRIEGATLAHEGALEEKLARLEAPLIYPFFMARGWFTGTELPRRLGLIGKADLPQLNPFGTDPDLPELVAQIATEGLTGPLTHDSLILVGHGSKVSRRSADSTYAMAEALRARTGFGTILCAFVEEAPFLRDVAATAPQATCLPFFALRAGHVEGDLPEALDAARFTGRRLAPVGEHPRTAALIARALVRRDLDPRRLGSAG